MQNIRPAKGVFLDPNALTFVFLELFSSSLITDNTSPMLYDKCEPGLTLKSNPPMAILVTSCNAGNLCESPGAIQMLFRRKDSLTTLQGPVVRKVDSAIRWIVIFSTFVKRDKAG